MKKISELLKQITKKSDHKEEKTGPDISSEKNKVYSLGADFSTQSVKIVILDIHEQEIIYTSKIEYDKIFPEYKTTGVTLDSSRPEVKHTSPFMLIEVLDYMFEKIKNDGIGLSRIKAFKIDAMQHCTVYVNETFEGKIKNLDPEIDMINQLKPSISRKTSPIWEDRSPVEEAKTLTELLIPRGSISQLTGNKAELRFPASQIMKWAKESPAEYNNTAHIFLLSAFLTSLLIGKIVPVDTGDGWGTNLNNRNIIFPGWSDTVLSTIDTYLSTYNIKSSLEKKIGKMCHYDTVLGYINPYFVKKYGINAEAIVLAGTGDNPAALLGCGGNIVISLGSSYTVFGVMKKIISSEKEEYNIFGYTKRKAMALSCMTNGAKVHDYLLRKHIIGSQSGEINNKDWQEYDKIAGQANLTKDEKLMLPYLLNESVPLSKEGIVREGFDENDAQANIRALHISQSLSLKLHSSHLTGVKSICIVGGSSKSPLLRQILTDVFDTPSYSIINPDFAAPIGCAISGAKTLLKITYEQAAEKFVQENKSTCLRPVPGNASHAAYLLKRYSALKKKHLG